MLVLACDYQSGPTLLRDIAQRQQLPTTYLEQLMVPLRKSGLLTATRGVNGGYQLAHDPETITLAQVITALEGPLELVECKSIANCNTPPCACALKMVMDEAGSLLTNYFAEITLAELCRRQHQLLEEVTPLELAIQAI
jgi:Rrf2 family iron-sulfur cluster assembly transcriptional regulator